MDWIEDRYGRIGKLDASARVVHWTYGTSRIPAATKYRVLSAEENGEEKFERQRAAMWSDAVKLESISHSVLRQLGVQRKTMRHEELHCDVGIPTLCLAAVMWDETRSVPIEAYARRLLRNSYRRALRLGCNRGGVQLGLTDKHSVEDTRASARVPSAGLSAREELLNLKLTADELDILLLRFDSGESFENIARALGLNSRSTPLHHLNKIMAKCQKQITSQKA